MAEKVCVAKELTLKQKEDVMALLLLQKAEAGADIYFRLKSELLRIYAAKPKDSYCKALTRTMVGLPSQLGYQIVNNVCKKPVKLVGCCCPAAVEALWQIQLPVNIRAHISNIEFNANTYKQVFESVDQVYLSSKQVSVAALQVAAVNLDETQAAFIDQNQPSQVAAFKAASQKNGSSGGGGKKNKNNKNNKNQNQGKSQGQGRGPCHSSNPPESCCDRHFRHGAGAWYCTAPSTCPWKDKTTAKACGPDRPGKSKEINSSDCDYDSLFPSLDAMEIQTNKIDFKQTRTESGSFIKTRLSQISQVQAEINLFRVQSDSVSPR